MRPTLLVLAFLAFALAQEVPSAAVPENTSERENTLVLVHALFRHGNRTPDQGSLYPTDQYTEDTYEPFGYGQLTTKGKTTEYNIGLWMRKAYGNLIPTQYTKDKVYSLATNYKRTKMSLELVLAGLFAPSETDKFNADINWQPIPFNIESETDGHLITVPQTNCINYMRYYYNYLFTDEAKSKFRTYQSLYDTISKYTNKKIKTSRDLSAVYFTLKSEDDFGLKLPEWSKNYYPEVLEEAASVEYEISTGTASLKKLVSGFLLKKIIDDTKQFISGTLSPERKVFLYSAHEFNIATMLRTLDVFYRHVPPFGATIFFEVHKINDQYGIKLYYQDYKETEPRLLIIPGCATFCPLNTLEQVVNNNLPGVADVCSTSGIEF